VPDKFAPPLWFLVHVFGFRWILHGLEINTENSRLGPVRAVKKKGGEGKVMVFVLFCVVCYAGGGVRVDGFPGDGEIVCVVGVLVGAGGRCVLPFFYCETRL
jgi:hypothetical protein